MNIRRIIYNIGKSNMFNKKFLSFTVLFCLLGVTKVSLAVETDWVSIIKMGCRENDTICFVYFDGAVPPYPSTCTKPVSSFNWDTAHPGGKNALTLFTTAYVAGKKLKLGVSSSCLSSAPTFDYYYIKD